MVWIQDPKQMQSKVHREMYSMNTDEAQPYYNTMLN